MSGDPIVDLVSEEKLRPFLPNGEHLMWTGKPITGIKLDWYDLFAIPFSLLWSGGVFGMVAATVSDHNYVATAGLIPLLIMACFLIIGRFFFGAWIRANTTYGMTEESIIIRAPIFAMPARIIKIKNLAGLTFNPKRNGAGSIGLGPVWRRNKHWLNITENAQEVYEQIQMRR